MIDKTSLELSKALEPILKGKVESPEFFWVRIRVEDEHRYGPPPHLHHYIWRVKNKIEINFDLAVEVYPAYTVCELMEVLPADLWVIDNVYDLVILKEHSDYIVQYSCCELLFTASCQHINPNPAEALGLMVLWLHGEGLLK